MRGGLGCGAEPGWEHSWQCLRGNLPAPGLESPRGRKKPRLLPMDRPHCPAPPPALQHEQVLMPEMRDAAEVGQARQSARAGLSSDDGLPVGIGTTTNCTERVKGRGGAARSACGPRWDAPVPLVSAATSATSVRWLCPSLQQPGDHGTAFLPRLRVQGALLPLHGQCSILRRTSPWAGVRLLLLRDKRSVWAGIQGSVLPTRRGLCLPTSTRSSDWSLALPELPKPSTGTSRGQPARSSGRRIQEFSEPSLYIRAGGSRRPPQPRLCAWGRGQASRGHLLSLPQRL